MRQAGSQSAWQARRHAGRRALAPLAWPLAPPRPSTLGARPPPPPPGRPPSTPTRLTAPAPSDRLVAAAAPATQAGTRAATRSRPSSSQNPPPQTPHRQTPIPLRSRGQRLPSRSGRPDQMGMGPQGGTPSQQDRTPTRHVPPPPREQHALTTVMSAIAARRPLLVPTRGRPPPRQPVPQSASRAAWNKPWRSPRPAAAAASCPSPRPPNLTTGRAFPSSPTTPRRTVAGSACATGVAGTLGGHCWQTQRQWGREVGRRWGGKGGGSAPRARGDAKQVGQRSGWIRWGGAASRGGGTSHPAGEVEGGEGETPGRV